MLEERLNYPPNLCIRNSIKLCHMKSQAKITQPKNEGIMA